VIGIDTGPSALQVTQGLLRLARSPFGEAGAGMAEAAARKADAMKRMVERMSKSLFYCVVESSLW
jgi:hypothetical protein